MEPLALLRRGLYVAALACLCGQASAQHHSLVPPPIVHQGFTVRSIGCHGSINSLDGDVVVGGPVDGNITVVRGSVIMQKGGSVSGTVTVAAGGFDNSVGAPVGAVKVTRDAPAGLKWNTHEPRAQEFDYQWWVRVAFQWGVLWLIVSLLAQLAAPRRSHTVHLALDARPWMMGSLGVATLGAAGVLVTFTVLFLSNPGVAPFGIVLLAVIGLLLAAMATIGYGAALEHFGGEVLRRFRRPGAGPVAARSTAVAVLFLAKLIPILGFATALFEGLLILAGIGAAVHTGLGSSRSWLAVRMRTQTIDAGI